MDSPTLQSYNYDEFWREQNSFFSFNFEPSFIFEPDVKPMVKFEFDLPSTQLSPSTSISSPNTSNRNSFIKLEEFNIELPKAEEEEEEVKKIKSKPRVRRQPSESTISSEKAIADDYRATKNLAKNYGSAIVSFASSEIAKPYLSKILPKENVDYDTFRSYVESAKGNIKNINAFRNLFMATNEDSIFTKASKRVLQEIATIFIKYFSVNWIFNGKISNKLVYLQWRFKLLRKIQDPENFTVLKGQKKRSAPTRQPKKKY